MAKNPLWRQSKRRRGKHMPLERPSREYRSVIEFAADARWRQLSPPPDVTNNRRLASAARARMSGEGFARLNMPLFGVTPELRLELIRAGMLVAANTLLQNNDATLLPEMWVRPWLYLVIAKYLRDRAGPYSAATREITAVLHDPVMQSAIVAEWDLQFPSSQIS
jgi:hypothetical protein